MCRENAAWRGYQNEVSIPECRGREGLECQAEELGLPQTPLLVATGKGVPSRTK